MSIDDRARREGTPIPVITDEDMLVFEDVYTRLQKLGMLESFVIPQKENPHLWATGQHKLYPLNTRVRRRTHYLRYNDTFQYVNTSAFHWNTRLQKGIDFTLSSLTMEEKTIIKSLVLHEGAVGGGKIHPVDADVVEETFRQLIEHCRNEIIGYGYDATVKNATDLLSYDYSNDKQLYSGGERRKNFIDLTIGAGMEFEVLCNALKSRYTHEEVNNLIEAGADAEMIVKLDTYSTPTGEPLFEFDTIIQNSIQDFPVEWLEEYIKIQYPDAVYMYNI